MMIEDTCTRSMQARRQPGVHVHLFCADRNGCISSAILLQRADTGMWGVISGKVETGETHFAAALRETFEETGIVPDAMVDTGIRTRIACRKYCLVVSVFAAVAWGVTGVRLDEENSDWALTPLVQTYQRIQIEGQRAFHAKALSALITTRGATLEPTHGGSHGIGVFGVSGELSERR